MELDIEGIFDFIEAKFFELQEERFRWEHLNNSMTLILRSKGAEKAQLFSESIKKLIKRENVEFDNRTSEEIETHVLDMFKKRLGDS